MKKPPYVYTVFPPFPRHPEFPLQEFKLRIIRYKNSKVMLDIREFITSDKFTGYSPKGVALIREQVLHLHTLMSDILKGMEDVETEVARTGASTLGKDQTGIQRQATSIPQSREGNRSVTPSLSQVGESLPNTTTVKEIPKEV